MKNILIYFVLFIVNLFIGEILILSMYSNLTGGGNKLFFYVFINTALFGLGFLNLVYVQQLKNYWHRVLLFYSYFIILFVVSFLSEYLNLDFMTIRYYNYNLVLMFYLIIGIASPFYLKKVRAISSERSLFLLNVVSAISIVMGIILYMFKNLVVGCFKSNISYQLVLIFLLFFMPSILFITSFCSHLIKFNDSTLFRRVLKRFYYCGFVLILTFIFVF